MLWCILFEAIRLMSAFGALDHICFSLMLMHSEDALFAEKSICPIRWNIMEKVYVETVIEKFFENPQKLYYFVLDLRNTCLVRRFHGNIWLRRRQLNFLLYAPNRLWFLANLIILFLHINLFLFTIQFSPSMIFFFWVAIK